MVSSSLPINERKTDSPTIAIKKIIQANSNVAIAAVIEPDSLPNLVTNANLTTCQQSASGYRDGVAYALKELNLPNVAMYLDAGHGGWLGWNDNVGESPHPLPSFSLSYIPF
jgi:cellulase/cellobiase CelA1